MAALAKPSRNKQQTRNKQQSSARPRGRAARIAEQRRQEARRRAVWIAAVAVVVVAGVMVVVVSRGGGSSDAAAPEGTVTVDVADRNHVQGTVAYEQTPPVGGNHAPVWQNCGFYTEPIGAEQGVHAMEHGAVWITYGPDVPAAAVDRLRGLAEGQSFVLVSSWQDGLPSAVVASAWGRQLEVSSASDPRLEEFVRAFQVGPNAPEPGAPCTGGVGEPG